MTPIKIPFVDETISPVYEILLCVELYLGAVFLVFAMCVVVFIPIIITHLEGWFT